MDPRVRRRSPMWAKAVTKPASASCVSPHSVRRGGFTLIEVLIALAIVAIALISALKASGSMVAANDALHRRLLASWSADNHLVEIRLAHDWPDVGTRTFDCSQGQVQMECEEEVSPTANPNFRRVVLR